MIASIVFLSALSSSCYLVFLVSW